MEGTLCIGGRKTALLTEQHAGEGHGRAFGILHSSAQPGLGGEGGGEEDGEQYRHERGHSRQGVGLVPQGPEAVTLREFRWHERGRSRQGPILKG